MKKNWIYTMAMACLLMAASCSDDKEDVIPEVIPTATGTVTDSDGNEYKWVRIGQLDWTAEGSRCGTPWYEGRYTTENGIARTFSAHNLEEAKANLLRFGNFYEYQEAVDNCPEGWRLPTDEDWKQLEMALGMSREESDKTGWRKGAAALMVQSGGGTMLNFGYGGQLAAYATANIEEYHVGDFGYYWSSTIDESAPYKSAFIRKITPAQPNKVERISTPVKYHYLMVRYVRDAR